MYSVFERDYRKKIRPLQKSHNFGKKIKENKLNRHILQGLVGVG